MLRGMYCLIDVSDGAIAEAPCHRVVFLTGHIAVHLAKELERLVQASGMVVGTLHRGMIMDVFAIVDRCVLDFTDRLVDHGDVFLATYRRITGAAANSKPESNSRDLNFIDTPSRCYAWVRKVLESKLTRK